MLIIPRLFLLARDWSKLITLLNMLHLKVGNIRGYIPCDITHFYCYRGGTCFVCLWSRTREHWKWIMLRAANGRLFINTSQLCWENLKDNKHSNLPLIQKYARIFSLDIICSSTLIVFFKLHSRKIVCISEQITFGNKYPCIFSRQMEAIISPFRIIMRL